MISRRLISGSILIALMTAVLVSVAGTSRAAGSVTPSITPRNGQTAVKVNDLIGLGGTVGPGASQGQVSSAKILAFDKSGNPINSATDDLTSDVSITGTTINVPYDYSVTKCPPPPAEQVKCIPSPAADGGTLVFEVTVQFTDGPATGRATVSIDLLPPILKSATIEDSTKLIVLFSEPVVKGEGDSPADWTVANKQGTQVPVASAVCNHGSCPFYERRELTIPPQDDDASLRVDFLEPPGNPAAAESYVDAAGNHTALTRVPQGWGNGECRCTVAIDTVPPAKPTIQAIDGETGKSAIGNDVTPTVQVGDLKDGTVAVVYSEDGTSPGWQEGEDVQIGAAIAGITRTATVQTCTDPTRAPQVFCDTIGADRIYALYAVARDPSGNLSETADSGTYTLDTVAPTVAFAGTNGMTVDVVFNEVVTGANNPADWSVSEGGPVLTVTGSGDRRVLATAGTVPQDARVRWSNASGTSPGADRAGNALGNVDVPAINALSPFVHVTDPVGKTWTAGTNYTITGTTENQAAVVRIFRDDNPHDGSPDTPGQPVATGSVSGDAFSVSVPLNAGPSVDNNFLVQAERTNPNITGPYADVPTIVQDSQDPTVSIQKPVAGQAIAGGTVRSVEWNATDPGSAALATATPGPMVATLGPGPIHIYRSLDGGATWEPAEDASRNGQASGAEPNDGQFDWLVPDTSTAQARIRVTAEDEAKRVGSGETGDFTIDAENPFFTAFTKDASHVLVRFSEPVSGLFTAAEWMIDGSFVRSVSPSGDLTGIQELTLESFQSIGKNDTPLIVYRNLVPVRQLTDQVGNELSPVSAKASDGIPPAIPTVTDPSAPVQTGTDTQQIKGTAEGESRVVVYRDTGNDGTPDVEVGSQQLTGTDPATPFDIAASLVDGENELLVGALDAAGNRSGLVNVPTITADLLPPDVQIVEPKAGDLVAGGYSNFLIRWIATDANMAPNSLSIEFSTDDGASFQTIGQNEDNDGFFEFAVPNEAVKAARVRVSALDIYGRVGTATSDPFEILFCEIPGTNGDDFLVGTDKGETICAYDGQDIVEARGGNDIILSGAGAKRLSGESGDDLVEGGPANDLLRGGSGEDELGGRGGNDRILGEEGKDRLEGGDGNDDLRGRSSNDRLLGEAGNDKLFGEEGNDDLAGGDGDDLLSGGSGKDSGAGDAGNDRIRGDSGNDQLKGGDGNDAITGSSGNDKLEGNEGRDRLNGGSGNDRLVGGPGKKDRCKGGAGANVVAKSCEKK